MEENISIDRDDVKILCPLCESMNCFQEEHCEQNGAIINSWLCMSCGYTSLSTYKNHSKMLKIILNSSPQIIVNLKKYDDKRHVWWFPSIINIPNKGILYPEGSSTDWQWVYAPTVLISEDEQKNYPIPSQDGKFYDSRLAVEQSKRFKPTEFYLAIKEMGAIVDLGNKIDINNLVQG